MSYAKYGRNIPEFVKRFREDEGLSQQGLADRLGKFHGQYVSNVERGMTTAPFAFCARLYKLLGIERRKYLMDLMNKAHEDWIIRLLDD
jgi:transcriptional regulator with XRE-family HTH domain